ncbi:MAG: glycosyltransferase family 4 protein [Myxococcota bacterium]|nr:glycosyltransferase family 4 protein [Myxococcota bacterium]
MRLKQIVMNKLSPPLNVCMVHSFHHNRGGDTTYTRQVTQGLQSRNHVVHPFAMQHPLNDSVPSQRYFAPWTPLSQKTKLRAKDILKLIWSRDAYQAFATAIDQLKPDVIHVQHLHRHLTPSILAAARLRKVPVVWTLHDYELLCPSGKMVRQGQMCSLCANGSVIPAVRHRCKWNNTAASLLSAIEHGTHRLIHIEDWIDAFVCPSQFLEKHLQKRIPVDRIHHIPNPVQLTKSKPASKNQWLVAGRLSPEKGFDVAIKAALKLPQYPLLICGDGPERQRLEHLANGAKHIHFLGMLPHETLQKHISESAIIAVPSKWPENFPYAVIEAQAQGKPTVASKMGGIIEQITHEETGLLVPPGDPIALHAAIARLFKKPEWAEELGRKAQSRVATVCRFETHLERLENLYTHVIFNRLN